MKERLLTQSILSLLFKRLRQKQHSNPLSTPERVYLRKKLDYYCQQLISVDSNPSAHYSLSKQSTKRHFITSQTKLN